MAQTFSERLVLRLRELGYWKGDRPDLLRFAIEKGYATNSMYQWARTQRPAVQVIPRLARDLGVDPAWLLWGDAAEAVKKAIVIAALGLGVGRGTLCCDPPRKIRKGLGAVPSKGTRSVRRARRVVARSWALSHP